MSERRDHARALFAPLGPTYDRVGATLSFGQDPALASDDGAARPARRWHACSTSRRAPVSSPSSSLAAGHDVTGSTRAPTCSRSRGSGSATPSSSSQASATEIPFPDASFDHLTFTYLLRYVDDPGATLAELARVVRPGGTIANLEFCVPRGLWRPLWDLYVGVGLPAAGRAGLAGLVRRRPVPRPVDPGVLRAVAARAPARALAGGGHRRRAGATHEPRGRGGDLGDHRR